MKALFKFFLIVLFPILAFGQIQTTVGDFKEKIYSGGLNPEFRFFVGSFNFRSLPKPLEPCKVDFVLEIPEEHSPIPENDWKIRINYHNNAVQIIGDTTFIWFGPHNVGSRYSGTFEFIPLRSGDCGVTLNYHSPVRHTAYENKKAGIGFRWCLSPDGELRYLGKGQGMPEDCGNINSVFFKGDSLTILDDPESRSSQPFEYKILAEPQPRIGDTTNIHFFLKARQDILTGCDLSIDVGSMELLNQPDKMNFPIFKDQLVECTFKVIPRPIRNGHGITFHISCEPEMGKMCKYSQIIECSFIYNNDSTLRYVNYEDGNYDYGHVEELKKTLFPNAFPWATDSDSKHIEIQGDSIKIY
jgi:hypothetical protein